MRDTSIHNGCVGLKGRARFRRNARVLICMLLAALLCMSAWQPAFAKVGDAGEKGTIIGTEGTADDPEQGITDEVKTGVAEATAKTEVGVFAKQGSAEIGDMVMEGACGFSDDGHGVQSAGMMRTCMEYVSQFDRAVIAHCEDESLTANGVVNEGRASTRLGMFGWPALGEELEVMRDIELCRLTGCPLHVAHISTARSLDLVRAAKAEGLPVTCEVTPHHLFLTEENITDSYNTNLKVNPPLRTRDDAEALVAGLADGSIDCVVSDHAPPAAHEKDCEFEIAYFGTVGLETTLPLMLTYLVDRGTVTWQRLVEVLAVAPRRILRLAPVAVEAGSAADLTLIDPEAAVTVTPEYFESKSKNSAFLGLHLKGAASDVVIGGKRVLEAGLVR